MGSKYISDLSIVSRSSWVISTILDRKSFLRGCGVNCNVMLKFSVRFATLKHFVKEKCSWFLGFAHGAVRFTEGVW